LIWKLVLSFVLTLRLFVSLFYSVNLG
jgi:hypothetical protein